jgi:DNA topoisomerase-1
LRRQKFVVSEIAQEEKSERPFPPLTTSLLQQRASVELGFSAKRTMMTAQQLYEGVDIGDGRTGLITYMRTDSFRISGEALESVRRYIRKEFGDDYVPERPHFWRSKAQAQEAHEAIRPTHVDKSPESLRRYLTNDQYRLYRLIWTRFVACQMKEARFLLTQVQIQAGRCTATANGREMKFDGYLRMSRAGRDDQILPKLAKGEELKVRDIVPSRHFTEPPPRFTEAGLIKMMEKHGIGRPSTYAPTVATIIERGYVRLEERKLIPTELGILVTEKLERHFADFINAGFTAAMEEKLDKIEEGQSDWVGLLREFYAGFVREIEKASVEMTAEGGTVGGEPCPKCGGAMGLRWTRFGKLVQCESEACAYKKPSAESVVPGQTCSQCQSPMGMRFGRRGKFLACTRYPDCTYTRSIVRGKVVNVTEGTVCEKSGHPMAVRMSRRGPFLGCTGYPACRNSKKIPAGWLSSLSKPAKPSHDEIEERE